jgi:hypothetical protein
VRCRARYGPSRTFDKMSADGLLCKCPGLEFRFNRYHALKVYQRLCATSAIDKVRSGVITETAFIPLR